MVVASKRWLLHNNSILAGCLTCAYFLFVLKHGFVFAYKVLQQGPAQYTMQADASYFFYPLLGIGQMDAGAQGDVRSCLMDWDNAAVVEHLNH